MKVFIPSHDYVHVRVLDWLGANVGGHSKRTREDKKVCRWVGNGWSLAFVCLDSVRFGWEVEFENEQDATLFLLRWT